MLIASRTRSGKQAFNRIEKSSGLTASMCTKWRANSTGSARLIELLLVSVALALPLAAQDTCTVNFPHDANPTAITDDYVCNFHQVDSQVYRGGRPRPSAYPKLEQLGVRTIINLEETENADEERDAVARFNATRKPENRIDFISFPITQAEINKSGVSGRQVHHLFQLIQDAPKPVFIHCYYGRDRTGAVIALYRMSLGGLPYQKAYEEAVHYKFSPEDYGLMRTLERYKNAKKLNSLIEP